MEHRLKLKDYLVAVAAIPRMDPVQEEAWRLKMVLEHSTAARRKLEEQYLPRVVKWTSPYRGGPLCFEDLIEAGNRAMLRGLRRYHAGSRMGLEDHLEEKVRDEVEAALMTRP